MYTVKIWQQQNFGATSTLDFTKEFQLPFVPQIGMNLIDTLPFDSNETFEIFLNQQDYYKTTIEYNIKENIFTVYQQFYWELKQWTADELEQKLNEYAAFGWQRLPDRNNDLEGLLKYYNDKSY